MSIRSKDWNIKNWITNGTDAPFYARKQFTVAKKPVKAQARVCGLGQFIFYINGKKMGEHELDPGWTNYRKLIQYVTFDVTDALVVGENVLGAEIGNGWFIKTGEHYTFSFPPFMPPNPNPYKPFGKSLVLALDLSILYEDGSTERVESDASFLVKKHPVVMSNVYGSETFEAKLHQEAWCTAGYDARGWETAEIVPEADAPTGTLIEQYQPPIKVIHDYNGKYLGEAGNCDIYDFGQNMSGILEFEVRGKAGDMIKMYPAEKLGPDGSVDQTAKGWGCVDSCITYIVGKDDVWETYRMKFTYFAGRYIGVEKLGKNGLLPEIRNLKGHAISSAWETDGTFTSDDERYNKIYNMIERTVEANMLSVHTDCPTIERFAWQEPNHLMAPSIFYMKNGKKLWDKFLLDMRTDQHTSEDFFLDLEGKRYYPGEGLMPAQCPCYIPNVLPVPGMGSFYDIIPWGSTCILGTYWHYWFYGDRKIIEDNYEAGMRYLEHLKRKVTEDGFINHGLGDWGNPQNELARDNIETAFLYADTVTLAMFSEILGKTEEKEKLESYAETVKTNYNEKLLVKHPKGFWCYRTWSHTDEIRMTQACEALPLYWGLVPDDKEGDIVKAFRDTLECENAFVSGEVGLPYIIQTARKYGMNDIIAKYVTRTSHPSYYAFVREGLTTLGEYWEENPRSHCHDMMGHIIEWYYNGIAGIQPQEPGFGKIVIRPYLPEGMTEFNCSYQSVKGEIKVHVKKDEKGVLLEACVPQGAEKEIAISNLAMRGKPVKVVEEKIKI